MHNNAGLVNTFPNAVGAYDFCPLAIAMHKTDPDSYLKRKGGNPGNSGLSFLKNRWKYITPGLCGRTAILNTR